MPTQESSPNHSITGEKLKEEVNETRLERAEIVESFLYEKSVMMISADPGVGKSVLVANLMASLSVGMFAFGSLFIPKPRICYYIPFERGKEEILERLKHIQKSVPIDWSRIHVNPHFIGKNVIDPRHADYIIEIIRQDCIPDIIFLDPIYAAVAGGLSTDDKASQFCRFTARLQAEFDCSIWLNHHTVKDTYSSFDGTKIGKLDPFYGSQWLKAHCTASYHMRENGSGGTILEKKKDSQGNLVDKLTLGFNPDDYTQFAIDHDNETTKEAKVKAFFRERYNLKKPFTFSQLRGCVRGVSISSLRRVLDTPLFLECYSKRKSIGYETLYEVTKEI